MKAVSYLYEQYQTNIAQKLLKISIANNHRCASLKRMRYAWFPSASLWVSTEFRKSQ